MKNWQPKQAGFFERLVLLFIKEQKHVSFDDELGTEVMLVYKKFRGVTYIIRFVPLPPKHVNCRCAFTPNNACNRPASAVGMQSESDKSAAGNANR